MDKFNRRVSRKAQARKILFILLALSLCAACFLALFIFGNAGAMWVIGILAFGLTLATLTQWKDLSRNYRLWLSGLRIQSPQGPGFSSLEVEAIRNLLGQVGAEAEALNRHFAGAEVFARYNSGAGSVTSFRSATPSKVSADIAPCVAWFAVDGVDGPVGSRLWADQDGVITSLEFFTGGRDTSHLDWTSVSFGPPPAGCERPPVPSTPPIGLEPKWIRYRPDH